MAVIVNKNEFYVINVSKFNVSLRDLYTTIPKYATVNLLSKHYNYTLEQLIESATSGSLYKKRDKIWLRNKDLKEEIEKVKLDQETVLKSRSKSTYVFEPEVFEELLDISDEEYISELTEEE